MDEKLKKELKRLEKGKQKARQANDRSEEASLCNIAGELLAQHRLFEDAIEEHRAELHLSESLHDTIAVAVAHRKIGECLCELQDFEQALVHQQKHLELSRKCQNIVEEQRALATIGRTLFQSAGSTSEFLKAQTAFLESLSVCDQLRDIVKEKELLEMRARLYLNLGLVYNQLKNQKKGMKYIERALTITVNLDLKDTEYRCHFSLGEIKLADNHPAEALQSFERARKVAQHQKMTFEEADTLVQMGQALLQLGDFNGAKNILKKCFKTMKQGNMVEELRSSFVKSIKGTRLLEKLENGLETNDEILMKIYEDLGDLYSSVKCFSKAVHYYVKQLGLSEVLGKSRKEKAVICYSIAQSYSDLKQYKKAKEYFWKELALQKGEPQEQCVTWCKIAEVTELAGGSFEEIEKAYNNALKHVRKYKNPTKEHHLLKLLSELRQKHKLDDDYALDEISTDPKIEEDLSEEQSLEHDDLDNDEDERLIQEEMEMSDSDDEHKEMNTSSTVRLKGKSKSIYKRNEKGETVLHVAAINGNYQLAKSSIEKGVSVHERDYCGWQPLHEACNHGNLSIVELLLDKGADINDPGGPHCRGMTPLHDAAQNGHVEVVNLLIARGASVSRSNKDGHTPLDLVMHSIDDDDEDDDVNENDDDLDVEVAEVREELARILRNAMKPGKRQSDKDSELRRRDKIELSDDSDAELSQDFSKVISIKPGEISRKRKNAVLESDEENTPRNSMNFNGNKSKVAKVSENVDSDSLLDDDSQDRYDRKIMESQGTAISKSRGVLVEDSDESSRDSVGDQRILQGKSQDSEDRLDSDPKNNQWPPFSELDIDSEHPSLSLEPSHTNTSISTPVLGNTTSRTSESLSRKSKNTSSITYVDPVTGNTQNDSRISESQPALIPENEYILTTTDDWLINDIPKTTGKRKRCGNILSMLGDSGSSCNTSSFSRVRTVSNVSSTGTQSTRVVETSRGHRTNNGAKNRLRQSRLTVVNGRSSPSEPEPVTTSSLASGGTSISEAPMRIRVKVEDKIFLIPCPIVPGERKTVRWLAEQAVFRYHSATGLKPILSLCTTEGASLSTDDPISEVLSNNEQVNAIVETWDLPPIHERYKVSCLMANTEVEMKILDVFERHPRISNVEFCNMSLTPAKLLPLFRSLQCHAELVKLALPGNRVGDIGLQHLVSSLPCLANLSVLNLGCNGITHKGLRNLASSLSQDEKVSKAWSNLKELDISFNTINDTGGFSLATILRSCPDLLKLNIERCSLSQNAFHQRSTLIEAIKDLKRLQYLNISHNLIHAECLPSLLAACTSVEILNLSSTVNSRDPAFTSVLADHLKVENCCIQSLICRCCYLNDRDASVLARVMNVSTSCCRILDLGENNISDEGVSKLIESVQCNPNVTGLIFSGNLQVTTESFSKFFTSPSNLIHLDLSHCRIRSPLPECLLNQTTFPRQLVHLNLSFNLLDGQDISSLGRLWNLKWQEKCIMAVTKSIVLFDARKDSSSM